MPHFTPASVRSSAKFPQDGQLAVGSVLHVS
jgi:hypothetical protein